MGETQQDNDYIDLGEMFSALFQRKGTIILVTILFGIVSFLYSKMIATPLYSASAMMIVNSGERYDYVTQDQLRSASSLVNTYSVIITSDTVMDVVVDNLDMEDTFEDEVTDITVAPVNDTQIMKITVTATDPGIALDVCREITSVVPDVIIRTVKVGSVELVAAAKAKEDPVSPRVGRNMTITMMLGLILSCAFVILVTVLDNKIKGETELRQADLTILGVIPCYETEGQ